MISAEATSTRVPRPSCSRAWTTSWRAHGLRDAHCLSTVHQLGSRLVVLDHGRIIEQEVYDDLSRRALYYQLATRAPSSSVSAQRSRCPGLVPVVGSSAWCGTWEWIWRRYCRPRISGGERVPKAGARWAARSCDDRSAIEATRRASLDLRFAAWFLWMTCGNEATSSLREAIRRRREPCHSPGLNGLALGLTDQGLQLGLHGLVTNAALLVGEDALLTDMFATVDSSLDVCLTGSVRAVSRQDLGVGTPANGLTHTARPGRGINDRSYQGRGFSSYPQRCAS